MPGITGLEAQGVKMSECEQDDTFEKQVDRIIQPWPLWKRVAIFKVFGLEYKGDPEATNG